MVRVDRRPEAALEIEGVIGQEAGHPVLDLPQEAPLNKTAMLVARVARCLRQAQQPQVVAAQLV
jgi:hypothetical protein